MLMSWVPQFRKSVSYLSTMPLMIKGTSRPLTWSDQQRIEPGKSLSTIFKYLEHMLNALLNSNTISLRIWIIHSLFSLNSLFCLRFFYSNCTILAVESLILHLRSTICSSIRVSSSLSCSCVKLRTYLNRFRPIRLVISTFLDLLFIEN